MPVDPKPKCPECDTEYVLVDGKPPAECAKCKFPFTTYVGFNRLFTAAVKDWRAKNPKKGGQPAEEDSFFDSLRELGSR